MTDLHTAAREALDGECDLWPGSLSQGYGVIFTAGRARRAHIDAWERAYGPVPAGMVLDHLCRRRSCVNVRHLEVVTNTENVLRGVGPTAINARKTHCANGHDLAAPNLLIDYRGNRRCRTCQLAHDRKYQARRRSEHAQT